jgi:hypothetical protein
MKRLTKDQKRQVAVIAAKRNVENCPGNAAKLLMGRSGDQNLPGGIGADLGVEIGYGARALAQRPLLFPINSPGFSNLASQSRVPGDGRPQAR